MNTSEKKMLTKKLPHQREVMILPGEITFNKVTEHPHVQNLHVESPMK